MSRADEVWSDTLEPTAVFTEIVFSSRVSHLESGLWQFCFISNSFALDGLYEGGFHLSESSLKVFNFEFKMNLVSK